MPAVQLAFRELMVGDARPDSRNPPHLQRYLSATTDKLKRALSGDRGEEVVAFEREQK